MQRLPAIRGSAAVLPVCPRCHVRVVPVYAAVAAAGGGESPTLGPGRFHELRIITQTLCNQAFACAIEGGDLAVKGSPVLLRLYMAVCATGIHN